MAISLDASTPAVTAPSGSTSTSVTTGSFSPPSASMVVVMVGLGYGPTGSSPGMTVQDSNGVSYTAGPQVFDSTFDYAGLFYHYYSSAPGSVTVTATRNNGTTAGWVLLPYVLTGASSTVGASNTANAGGTSWTGSITTTVTGSWVLLSTTITNNPTVTPNGSTTTITNFKDASDGETLLQGKATSPTGTPGATTLGWTGTASNSYAWAALEIVPATTTGAVSSGFTFGSSATGAAGTSSVSTGFTLSSHVSGAPAGPAGVAQVVTAGVINDYGLDNIPFTMLSPSTSAGGMGNSLVAFIGWDVSFFGYQSSGRSPAVNVTDSAGNLWRQIGITPQQSGARAAIWMAVNAQQVSWISVATTGWTYSTSYVIAEIDTPLTMQQVSIDFVRTANTNNAVSTLTVPPGTATATDMCFAIMCTGTNTSNPSSPAGWTNIGTAGAASAFDATVNAYYINSQAAGAVAFGPSWTTAAPAAGIIVALKRTAAAPVQPNTGYPQVVVEAAFGADPGDWTQSTDYTFSIEGLTWTDITTRCIGPEDKAVITVTRGRQYELTQEETGEITMSLDNHDGAFTAGNTASPFFPNVQPGVPIRVTAWWNQNAVYGVPVATPWSFAVSGTPVGQFFIVATSQAASIATGDKLTDTSNAGTVFSVTSLSAPFGGFVNVFVSPAPGTAMNAPDTVSQLVGNPIQYPVGFGYVERWPQDWPDLPQWGFTEVTATDAYGPLAATTMPSAVEGDIRKDYPYAYFPTDEQYSFTNNSLTNVTIGGFFVFGGTKIPIDANGLIAVNKAFGNTRNGAYRDGGDGAQANTGQALNLLGDADTAFGNANYPGVIPAIGGPVMMYSDPNLPVNSASQGFAYEFWFLTGWQANNFSCTLLTAYATPSAYYNASGSNGAVITVGVNLGKTPGLSVNGTVIASATTSPSFAGSNPNPQHLVINLSPAGLRIYLNGQLTTGGTPPVPSFTKVNAVLLGSGRYSYDNSSIASYQGYNFVAGHLAIYQHELTPTMVFNHYASGANGFIGVSAALRYSQVLTWALLGLKRGGCMWTAAHGTTENTTMSEAYSYEGTTGADLMNQLTTTEGGRCFTTANGSLIYMPRWNLYNQPPQAAFGDNGTTEIPFGQDTGYGIDNTFIYNQIDGTQNRGPNTTIYYQQTSTASQLNYFNRSGLSVQSYAMSPFDVYGAVNWASAKYNNPVQRVTQVTVDPAKTQAKVTSAFSTVLALELQDAVTVTRRPVGGAVLAVTGTIQRVEHQIGPGIWQTTYQVVPRFPDSNALVADSASNNTLGASYLAW